MNQTNSEIANLLRDLAAQMGTTVKFLWEVLVIQAHISGWVYLGLIVVSLLLGSILARKALQESRKPDKEANDDFMIFCTAAAIVVLTTSLLILAASAEMIAAAFFNPEYWALMKLLEVLPK